MTATRDAIEDFERKAAELEAVINRLKAQNAEAVEAVNQVRTMNILTTRQRCRQLCASTWRYDHGESQPGGPNRGTYGRTGDVRLCIHGRLWRWYGSGLTPVFEVEVDRWELLSRFWEPISFWRARRAFSANENGEQG